jgi:hypothetical protein
LTLTNYSNPIQLDGPSEMADSRASLNRAIIYDDDDGIEGNSLNFRDLSVPSYEQQGGQKDDMSSCGLLDKQIPSHHKLKGAYRQQNYS